MNYLFLDQLPPSVALLLALCKDAVFLLALSFLQGLVSRRWHGRRFSWLITALLFSGIASLGMINGIEIQPGKSLDARSAVLSMASLFGGYRVAIVSGVLTVCVRILLGGSGVVPGSIMIVVCVLVGMCYRFLYMRYPQVFKINFLYLLGFGFALHIVILISMFLSTEGRWVLVATNAIAFVAAETLATAFLGSLLQFMQRHLDAENALRESQARLRAVSLAMPGKIALVDLEGNFDTSFLNLPKGDDISRLTPKLFDQANPFATKQKLREAVAACLEFNQTQSFEYELHDGDVSRYYIGYCSPIDQFVEEHRSVAFLSLDISERKQGEQALHESETRYRLAFQTTPDAIAIVRLKDRTYLDINDGFERISGWSRQEVIGRTTSDLNIWVNSGDRDRLVESLRRDSLFENQECKLRVKDGTVITALMSSHLLLLEGEVCALSVTRDISDRKKAEEKIKTLAYYDPLTLLPNRRLLKIRAEAVIADSSAKGKSCALLFIDLDDFKLINDTHGHDQGDEVLKDVSHRIKEVLRVSDDVFRLGGDEFVLLIKELPLSLVESTDQLSSIASKVLHKISQPISVGEQTYICSASIGIAVSDMNTDSLDEIMRRADLAMYKAKSLGRNQFFFYDADTQAEFYDRVMLEADLREAVDQKGFKLFYQPQVDVLGNIIGAEALIRWQHPVRGNVPPNDFIPIAEETSLIIALGDWVLDTACSQLAQWQANPAFNTLRLSINISTKQIQQPDFFSKVAECLDRYHLPPQSLRLELTESVFLDEFENTIATMTSLKLLGVSFSLDDFGIGYSSLSYLKRLPLDELKIDRLFVRDLLGDPKDEAFCKTIIQLADSLGLKAVAEGVETVAQHQKLNTLGCRYFQGYFFGAPMPIQDYEALVCQMRS